MRRIPLLLALLLGAPKLSAQGAWTGYLDQLRERNQPSGRWTLLVRTEDLKDQAWQQTDFLFKLGISGEFGIQGLPEILRQELWQSRRWPLESAHWLLISPEGASPVEGSGKPTSEAILSGLRSAGFQPRWERREAFLKDHPGHGEAQAEQVDHAFRLGSRRGFLYLNQGLLAKNKTNSPTMDFNRPLTFSFATEQDPSGAILATEAFGEAAEELAHFMAIPGWIYGSPVSLVAAMFSVHNLGQTPRLRTLGLQALNELEQELVREPHLNGLWMNYGRLATALGQDPQEPMGKAVPVPGFPWPPAPYLGTVIDTYFLQEDWPAALAFLDRIGTLALPGYLTQDLWNDHTAFQTQLHLQRARVLGRLERWPEVRAEIQETRRWAGMRWPGLVNGTLRRLIPTLFTAPQKATFEPLLHQEPLPELPLPPKPEPGRLVWVGEGPWADPWRRLQRHPSLQNWGPAELQWGSLAGPQEQALRNRQGWGPEPHWVLIQGDQIHASGDTLPSPEGLGERLHGLLPSRLEDLNQAIQKAPANLALRRARAELLFERMPNGLLEYQLAEDARLAALVVEIPKATWNPNPDLWQWAAQKVLSEVEQDLRRWPSRTYAWQVWVSWADLHPLRPSPLALARSLTPWGDGQHWGSRLPKEVHLAVAEELRRGGRYEEMRAWFQDAWEGLDHTPSVRGRGPKWFQDQRKDQDEAIVKPLKEALLALRRDHDFLALEQSLAARNGETGRPASRKRTR